MSTGHFFNPAHCSWASLPETVYQYIVPILSPVADNSAEGGNIFHDLGTARLRIGDATDRDTATAVHARSRKVSRGQASDQGGSKKKFQSPYPGNRGGPVPLSPSGSAYGCARMRRYR